MLLRYLFLGAFYANDKEMLLLRLNCIKITCRLHVYSCDPQGQELTPVCSPAATLDLSLFLLKYFVVCLHEWVEDEWWRMLGWPQTQANGGAWVPAMSPSAGRSLHILEHQSSPALVSHDGNSNLRSQQGADGSRDFLERHQSAFSESHFLSLVSGRKSNCGKNKSH